MCNFYLSKIFLILFFQFFSIGQAIEMPITIQKYSQDKTFSKNLDAEILDFLNHMLKLRNSAFDRIQISQEDCVRSTSCDFLNNLAYNLNKLQTKNDFINYKFQTLENKIELKHIISYFASNYSNFRYPKNKFQLPNEYKTNSCIPLNLKVIYPNFFITLALFTGSFTFTLCGILARYNIIPSIYDFQISGIFVIGGPMLMIIFGGFLIYISKILHECKKYYREMNLFNTNLANYFKNELVEVKVKDCDESCMDNIEVKTLIETQISLNEC